MDIWYTLEELPSRLKLPIEKIEWLAEQSKITLTAREIPGRNFVDPANPQMYQKRLNDLVNDWSFNPYLGLLIKVRSIVGHPDFPQNLLVVATREEVERYESQASTLMKRLIIDGLEIIPVRRIPFITEHQIGPTAISKILANKLDINGWDYEEIECDVFDEETGCTKRRLIIPSGTDNGVSAYKLDDEGKLVSIRPSYWEDIYSQLQRFKSVLEMKDKEVGVSKSQVSAWRRKTTEILPPGVFLWKSDLDLVWQAHRSRISSLPEIYNDTPTSPEEERIHFRGFERMMPERTYENVNNTGEVQLNYRRSIPLEVKDRVSNAFDLRMEIQGTIQQESTKKNTIPEDSEAKSNEMLIAEDVVKTFWIVPPPEGYNRPTSDQIVEWIIENYQITQKAAKRIYTLTRPDNIPRHGNLPQENRPYPIPSRNSE